MARIADRWWIMLARGLTSFAFAGLLVLVSGWSSLRTLAVVFGIWALVDGIESLALVVGVRRIRVGLYIGRGCLEIAVGAFALALPSTSTFLLYTLVGAWAIGSGALEMAFASRRWFVLPRALGFMLIGAISLAFGMFLVPFPLMGVATLRALLVAFAIVSGIAAMIVGEKLHGPPGHAPPQPT
jgi:uncharacterized membrane protein HdeD (DUF308 family)